MSNLDKALEWANGISYHPCSHEPEEVEAARIILNLPDQWVDAEKVREEADRMDSGAVNAMKPGHNEFSRGYAEAMQECAEHLRNLLTPKLPTLADMTPEERKACQWMQADIHGGGRGVIAFITEDDLAAIWFENPNQKHFELSEVTPRPDLPKLKWPGDGVVHCETVDETETVEETPAEKAALPKPEDLPPNELWLVEYNGLEFVGKRNREDYINCPWRIASVNDEGSDIARDSEITLIHKLVAEPPALPKGMRLADHTRYGRVVVSPKADEYGEHRIFCSSDDTESLTGSDWGFVKESKLTILDGNQ